MRKGCYLCKRWDDKKRSWVYHMGTITDWKPPSGVNPRMRQFRCSGCRGLFYIVLTPERI